MVFDIEVVKINDVPNDYCYKSTVERNNLTFKTLK